MNNILQQLANLRAATDTANRYRDKARAGYHVPGELEIGQTAEVHRTDAGAWIRAYVFIPKDKLAT